MSYTILSSDARVRALGKTELKAERSFMNHKLRSLSLTLVMLAPIVLIPAALAQTPPKHAMTFDDLIAMQRVSEPQISPDGRSVVYTVGTPEMDSNRVARNIWIVSTAPGGQPRQLTHTGKDTRPQWSPDGKKIAFISSRETVSQIYVMGAQGGNPKKIT